MSRFAVNFAFLFICWLALTFTLDLQEVLLGLGVSLIVAHISGEFFFSRKPLKLLSPRRWAYGFAYIIAFIWAEARCHLDVCCRIITGRINPAIVRLETGHKTDPGKTLLANTITLTPGTLTIKAGKSFFIHWIAYVKGKEQDISGPFEHLGRIVAND